MKMNSLHFRYIKHTLLTAIISSFCFVGLSAQSSDNTWDPWKQIEDEGQRFLMNEVYSISQDSIQKLRIDKIIHDQDKGDGILLTLTAYNFNGERGVVMTSHDSSVIHPNIQIGGNQPGTFVNLLLTDSEFKELMEIVEDLGKTSEYKVHHIKRFNSDLIVDVMKTGEELSFCNLWILGRTKHSQPISKWQRAYRRYLDFQEE